MEFKKIGDLHGDFPIKVTPTFFTPEHQVTPGYRCSLYTFWVTSKRAINGLATGCGQDRDMPVMENTQSHERRRGARHRALLAAKMATEDASLTIDCVIRNISDTGALVETTSPQLLPADLHLVQLKDGVVWDAKVVWRRGHQVGLELGARHDLRETTDKQLKALRRIWAMMSLR